MQVEKADLIDAEQAAVCAAAGCVKKRLAKASTKSERASVVKWRAMDLMCILFGFEDVFAVDKVFKVCVVER